MSAERHIAKVSDKKPIPFFIIKCWCGFYDEEYTKEAANYVAASHNNPPTWNSL